MFPEWSTRNTDESSYVSSRDLNSGPHTSQNSGPLTSLEVTSPDSGFPFLFFSSALFVETGSYYGALTGYIGQADLEVTEIPLPLIPECWDERSVLLYLILVSLWLVGFVTIIKSLRYTPVFFQCLGLHMSKIQMKTNMLLVYTC